MTFPFISCCSGEWILLNQVVGWLQPYGKAEHLVYSFLSHSVSTFFHKLVTETVILIPPFFKTYLCQLPSKINLILPQQVSKQGLYQKRHLNLYSGYNNCLIFHSLVHFNQLLHAII